MPELRWTLLALGVLFVGGLVLWDRRRARGGGSGVGGPGWREPRAHAASAAAPAPVDYVREAPDRREYDPRDPDTLPDIRVSEVARELPVFEVGDLNLPGADAVSGGKRHPRITLLDEATVDIPGVSRRSVACDTAASEDRADGGLAESVAVPVDSPRAEPATAAKLVIDWPPEDERRFLSVRLIATNDSRFPGHAVRQALSSEGFVHGPLDVFHLPMPDGRVVFSAASLTKPGTFDLATMDAQRFSGLSLFAVLPGPLPEALTLEEIVNVGRMLAQRLGGELRDHRGERLTTQRLAEIRAALSGGATQTLANGERRG